MDERALAAADALHVAVLAVRLLWLHLEVLEHELLGPGEVRLGLPRLFIDARVKFEVPKYLELTNGEQATGVRIRLSDNAHVQDLLHGVLLILPLGFIVRRLPLRAQVVAQEERLQEAQRESRRTAREQGKRQKQLREAVNGDVSLFNVAAVGRARGVARPTASLPCEYCIAAYDGLLGAGGVPAWNTVPDGYPRPRSFNSVYANVACAVQLLRRLLPVVLWLEKHADVCTEVEGCIVCALRRSCGSTHDGVLVKQRQYMPVGISLEELTTAKYFDWLLQSLCVREQRVACVQREEDGCARDGGDDVVTHVDRLFAYQVETRRECVGCRRLVAEWSWERSWWVSTQCCEYDDASVTDLFLRSCAVREERKRCERCKSDQVHRVQRRLLSLPNIMVVCIDRERAMQVRASDQLVLALFGFENLDLAGVCYERGLQQSSCACRSSDGEFWYLKAGAEPMCIGPSVGQILPGRVSVAVYQRQGGAAAFEGGLVDLPRDNVPARAPVARGGTGTASVSAAVQHVGRADAMASRSDVSGNLFWSSAHRRTFADMYFDFREEARAALMYKNTVVSRLVAWLPEAVTVVSKKSNKKGETRIVRVAVVDRIMEFLVGVRRPWMPSMPILRRFGIFVLSLSRQGVTRTAFDELRANEDKKRKQAYAEAMENRLRAEATRLSLLKERTAAADARLEAARRTSERSARSDMQAALVRASVRATLEQRGVGLDASQLSSAAASTDAVAAKMQAGASSRAAAAADERAMLEQTRGIGDVGAAQRMADRAAARARLDALARGDATKAKGASAAEVARSVKEAMQRQRAAPGVHDRRPRGAVFVEESPLFQGLLKDSVFPWGEIAPGLQANVACALLAALQETLGETMVEKLAVADWFCDLDICREFKREAAQLLAGLEVDGNDLGLATLTFVGVLPKVVFRLTDLARDQARRDVSVRMSNTEALERLRQQGYACGQGKLWGRNNCLADSLLQLLVRHRVICWDPANGDFDDDARVRRDVCNRNRDNFLSLIHI